MSATKMILLSLVLSAGASQLISSPSSLVARQNLEEESPVDGGEEYPENGGVVTDSPGNGAEWDPVCPRTGSAAVCLDCTKISVCLRGTVLPARDCPLDAPYCVNSDISGAHCSARPDEEREGCTSSFRCSSEGYFPDPNNCYYYYLCDADLNAFKYDCMPGYVYDMTNKNCRRQIFPSECKTLDCAKSNGVWVYYDNNKQFYGYCYQSESGSEEVVLFKCSDGSEFNGQQCQYKCRSEGKFPDTQDRSRYFECYFVGFTLNSRVKQCATGMVFDENAKICKSSQGVRHR
ncbi:uncharacterized protein LOC134204068 [Armigeres subalbatus]|uniref:uncharacterized protein LOC134204068 n=1 Tax=Armigeres subalbatus TaxID=124917 RepID=UPI002ED41878